MHYNKHTKLKKNNLVIIIWYTIIYSPLTIKKII